MVVDIQCRGGALTALLSPAPSRPCLQTELSEVEVPWPEYAASRRGQASCAASASLCSRSCLSVQGLPPPRAFLTRMKLMGSL